MNLNTDLLREIATTIELEDRFNLGHFGVDNRSGKAIDDPDALLEDCGTAGCVAGYINAKAGRSLFLEWAAADDLGAMTQADRRLIHDRLFYATDGSVWVEMADAFGWEVDHYPPLMTPDGRQLSEDYTGLKDWSCITGLQAAKVLRMVADGEIEFDNRPKED